jgi:steroid delta-isomerase-like uncharacterized protein
MTPVVARNWALRLSLIALLSACDAHSQAGRLLAGRWIDAMNAHRAEEVLALFAPDATYSEPGLEGRVDSIPLAERLENGWAQWKDRVLTPTRIMLADAGTAVVEWEMNQTHPSGKHLAVSGVTVIESDGGRIRALRTYYNAVPFLQFLPRKSQERS